MQESVTESKEEKYLRLLHKHGICEKCGEMYEHEIDAPFASCGCCTSEWSSVESFTPYMKLQAKLYAATKEATNG